MTLLAIGLAAVAVALLVSGRPAVGVPAAGTGSGGRAAYVVVVAAAAVAAVAGLDRPRLVVVAVVVAGAVLGAVHLVRRHAADRAAAVVRARVVEVCEGLQAELAAGQTPLTALERAAAEWPFLQPIARLAAAGGDVPSALRDLAGRPGAGDLRVVAGAWQVAHRTGHGLGDAVGRVAQELREAEHTRRIVSGELASARATARLVAALPVLALLMGSGAGADPWSFLVGHPVGLACLAGGLACGLAGLTWIEALARDVERGR